MISKVFHTVNFLSTIRTFIDYSNFLSFMRIFVGHWNFLSNTCTFRRKFALNLRHFEALTRYFANVNTPSTADDNDNESLSEVNESVSASDSELLSSDQSELSDSDRNEPTPIQSKRQRTSSTTTTVTCSTQAAKKKFCHAWLKDFTWLEYKKGQNVMLCKLCRELGKGGPWGMTGTNNFRYVVYSLYRQSYLVMHSCISIL